MSQHNIKDTLSKGRTFRTTVYVPVRSKRFYELACEFSNTNKSLVDPVKTAGCYRAVRLHGFDWACKNYLMLTEAEKQAICDDVLAEENLHKINTQTA